MTIGVHHQIGAELLIVIGCRVAMLFGHNTLRTFQRFVRSILNVIAVRLAMRIVEPIVRVRMLFGVVRLLHGRSIGMAMMTVRGILARTVADVRPHHVENADNQNAILDDERIEIRRYVAMDEVEHVGPQANVLHVLVLLDVQGDFDGVDRFGDNRVDPHGQRCAQRMHQHDARQAAVLVDDHVHVFEYEEQHEERVKGKKDVLGERYF